MKRTILVVAFLVPLAAAALAQAREPDNSIAVKVTIDGRPLRCNDLKITLNVQGRHILPRRTRNGFLVPPEVLKLIAASEPSECVDVDVSCGEVRLNFEHLYPSQVAPGYWEIGIAYPVYAREHYGYMHAVEQEMWVSFLVSECFDCDPGVVMTVPHAEVPEGELDRLLKRQHNARGPQARDVAFALAVFKQEYESNRAFLLDRLWECLARPEKEISDSEDDVCSDAKLLDYIATLYWRGDSELLPELLKIAGSRSRVAEDAGKFYGDLLIRRSADFVSALGACPADIQQMVCTRAGESFLDKRELTQAAANLRVTGEGVAIRCLAFAEKAAANPSWKKDSSR